MRRPSQTPSASVPGSLRERLFTPFLTAKSSGTGLGQAVSHSLVESHRGRLDYRPNRPCGSDFTVALPVNDAVAGQGIPAR